MKPRRLTVAELTHLRYLIERNLDEGSYTGNREHYMNRSLRLLVWINGQLAMKGVR